MSTCFQISVIARHQSHASSVTELTNQHFRTLIENELKLFRGYELNRINAANHVRPKMSIFQAREGRTWLKDYI
jgi:hypothetical protein